jgi:hypothetical protein
MHYILWSIQVANTIYASLGLDQRGRAAAKRAIVFRVGAIQIAPLVIEQVKHGKGFVLSSFEFRRTVAFPYSDGRQRPL